MHSVWILIFSLVSVANDSCLGVIDLGMGEMFDICLNGQAIITETSST
jgi:hypothetical protein